MTIVVPVVILLGVLWVLYDRECALALTVLGVALLALWGYRRYASSMYVGTAVKALVALYLVALIVLAVLTKQGKTGKLLPRLRTVCRSISPVACPLWRCWPRWQFPAPRIMPSGPWRR